ncbi:MAG: carbohydrate-binding domain-containing protein [Bacilli bacterium]|nr:carbohydrate-binding domain-containing protein [Bacilli bacterium]
MKKVLRTPLLLAVTLMLFSCDSDAGKENRVPSNDVSSLSPTGSLSSSPNVNAPSSNNSDGGEAVAFTHQMNAVTATGIAPRASLPSIDEGPLSVETTQETVEVSEDCTLSGDSYQNGVEIKTAKNGSISLTLSGAKIYASKADGRALYNTNKGVSVTLTLAEGTTNYIYTNEDDAHAIQVKGNLTINGKGKLVVISANKAAIKVSGACLIEEATLELSAGTYGINASNVTVNNAKIDVLTAQKDGIRAEMDDLEVEDGIHAAKPNFPADDGFVKLNNVAYSATVAGDGVQASTTIDVLGGSIDIKTSGTWVNYTSDNIALYELVDDDFKWTPSGDSFKKLASDQVNNNYSRYYAFAQSSKGFKVGGLKYSYSDDSSNAYELESTSYRLTISSGAVVNLITSDSGAKVDYGDVYIDGGANVTVSAGNKGMAPEHDFVIDGESTKLTVTNSFEGVEAAHVYFRGGTSLLSTADDGINASTDYSSNSTYNDLLIQVDGGTLSLRSTGDGLDSNGDIKLNGGTVLVAGPTDGGNGPIDAGDRNKVYFNGADVISVSSSGMLESNSFSTDSSAYTILVGGTVNSGTLVALLDSSGKEVLSTKATCSGGAVIFSSNKIRTGSYKVKIGSTETNITVSSKITTSGVSSGGGPGGGGFPGGGGSPGGR